MVPDRGPRETPASTGFVLWTRVTPSAGAVPGSAAGAVVPGRWEVATDPRSGSVVRSGIARSAHRPTRPRLLLPPLGTTASDGGEGLWYDSGKVYVTTKGENRLYRG